MFNLEQVTLGSDCEVFLRTVAGAPFPVCGLLGGTKEAPKPIEELGEGFAVQEDNGAAEFNVPPTNRSSQFAHNFNSITAHISSKLPATLLLDLENSSLEFDKEYVEKIEQLRVFGCNPDFNAWTMSVNPRPVPQTVGFRSASAHVHIGWCKGEEEPLMDDQIEVIRLCDVFVTLPRILKENASERLRRSLYGKAGSFRPKPYGVEHRVLGNRWAFNWHTAEAVAQSYWRALTAYTLGVKVQHDDFTLIQELINNFNPEDTNHIVQAKTLTRKYTQEAIDKAGGLGMWYTLSHK
jgi:hypothetical protein